MLTASKRLLGGLAALAAIGPAPLALAAGAQASGPAVVLGARAFARFGTGFGTSHPREIFNGGDPSGLVSSLRWSGWGAASTTATGRTSIFKPGGGYYPQLVSAALRASHLGHCSAHGPLAYTRLEVRVPSRPGGPLGRWRLWSGVKSICHAP